MKSLLLVVITATLAASVACSMSPAPNPTPTATATPTGSSTSSEQTTARSTEPANASFLRVFSPQNESVVDRAEVDVQGQTTPDAVVSVNGEPVDVDAQGLFTSTVQLEEGPNVIEIVASDFQGRQEAVVITLISTHTSS